MDFFTAPQWLVKCLVNFWPPIFFAGIKVTDIRADFRYVKVVMPLRFYNKNILGAHYGGSLFSLTDPFMMCMIWRNLGNAYRVIDQAGNIEFVTLGKTAVYAEFFLTDEDLREIKQKTASGEKYLKDFLIDIKDKNDEVVAKVCRTIYVRLKNH